METSDSAAVKKIKVNHARELKKIQCKVNLWRGLIISIVFLTFAAYFVNFGSDSSFLSSDNAVWGAYGDFIGGILNPIMAFSAFYWLTMSVIVQKRELHETKLALVTSSESQENLAEAQEETVKEMRISSFLEVCNIPIRLDTLALEAEYTYLNHLHNVALKQGYSLNVYNKAMKFLPISQVIKDTLVEIQKLEGKVYKAQATLIASKANIRENTETPSENSETP